MTYRLTQYLALASCEGVRGSGGGEKSLQNLQAQIFLGYPKLGMSQMTLRLFFQASQREPLSDNFLNGNTHDQVKTLFSDCPQPGPSARPERRLGRLSIEPGLRAIGPGHPTFGQSLRQSIRRLFQRHRGGD